MPTYLKYFIIVFLAAVLFLPFLGNVHLFDWDEVNFAECAREMITTGDYLRPQIDYQPFWEKPPLFIWIEVLSMRLFGVGEYAARFPNAIMGILTLVTLFYIGKRVLNEKMATWWVLLYATCWLPHFYFKSGIIDPTFNFFIFLAFFQLYLLRYAKYKVLHALLAGFLLGLAVMTKGPVAVLIALLCFIVYLIVNKGLWGYKIGHLLIITFTAAVPFAIWIGIAMLVYGWDYGIWFVGDFITYQVKLLTTEDAGHGGFLLYHFVVLLIGCFPASIFLFQYSRKRSLANEHARDFARWMWILLSVVLILFTLVKTKIVHYSSLCYFPLTYLAALKLAELTDHPRDLKKIVKVLFLVIGILLSLVFIALPIAGINIAQIIPYVKDPIARANFTADVSWHWSESLWGLLYLAVIIGTFFFMKKNFRKAFIAMCIGQVFIVQVLILHFTPKIEAYTQRAAIEYYKSFVGKNVYIYPLGFHSYAYLFYSQKPPTIHGMGDMYWLLKVPVDRPSYFICRVNNADEYKQKPRIVETGRKNGFVFFKHIEVVPN